VGDGGEFRKVISFMVDSKDENIRNEVSHGYDRKRLLARKEGVDKFYEPFFNIDEDFVSTPADS